MLPDVVEPDEVPVEPDVVPEVEVPDWLLDFLLFLVELVVDPDPDPLVVPEVDPPVVPEVVVLFTVRRLESDSFAILLESTNVQEAKSPRIAKDFNELFFGVVII